MEVEIEFKGDSQIVFVNGKDYTNKIRQEEISILTSLLAPYLSVREKVLSVQRKFAKDYNCVIEGRDIGTVVPAKSKLQIFCDCL